MHTVPSRQRTARILPTAFERQHDARTGREVLCLSPAGQRAEATYFECQAFTRGDRLVVYRARTPEGWQLVRADMETGELRVLAPCGADGSVNTFTVAQDGRTGWFVADGRLMRLDVEQATPAEAIGALDQRLADALVPYPVSIAADRFVALASRAVDGDMTLWRYDTRYDRLDRLLDVPGGFSHPLVCPTDPELLTFVRNGNHCWNMDVEDAQRVRTWRVRVGEPSPTPLVTPIRYRTATHESWSPEGLRLFFFDKNWKEWLPASVCSVDCGGGDWQVHYTSYRYRLGHGSVSPCGRYFVADCQQAGFSPLLRIDLSTGQADIVCWPDASQEGGHEAQAHVHASFSHTGRWIVFTSDREGYPRVYAVESAAQSEPTLPGKP